MDATNIERITAFEERFFRSQTTNVVELPWGYALLHSDFPQSYVHNRLIVASPANVADICTTADEILGGAGLGHRYISVLGDLGNTLAPEFAAAGYDHESVAIMIYRGPSAEPSAHEVHAVALDVLRPALIRDWKVDLPGRADEVYNQRGEQAECDLFYLVADLDDWPYGWYQRLGFVDIARKHNFTLVR